MTALRAEFRKLLTVRSTYFITALITLAVVIIAFWPSGLNASASDLKNPGLLAGDLTGALNTCVIGAIIAILLVTHEYRYNTIMYTLTTSRSRGKVLLAKTLVISVYAIFLAVLIAVLSPVFSYLGIHAKGDLLVPQTFHFGSLAWRTIYYGWAYGMAGFVIAVLIRNQVAALVTLLLFPGLVEGLLTELLKSKAVYLPFSSLNTLVRSDNFGGGSLSHGTAVIVFTSYLAVGGAFAWYFFIRRDASSG